MLMRMLMNVGSRHSNERVNSHSPTYYNTTCTIGPHAWYESSVLSANAQPSLVNQFIVVQLFIN